MEETKWQRGYWITHVNERYKDYVTTAKSVFERFCANFLAHGGALTELEGKARGLNIVIEFPAVQHTIDYYNSPEYQAAATIRQEVADAKW